MSDGLFASNFKATPYWWEDHAEPPTAPAALPSKADVVVIGSGFTGISAALTLARAGRDVVVLEADRPGFGCSTRNGGHLGPGIRNPYADLAAAFGKDEAYALKKEGHDAYKFTTDLIEREGIDCRFVRRGHFVGAPHTAFLRPPPHPGRQRAPRVRGDSAGREERCAPRGRHRCLSRCAGLSELRRPRPPSSITRA